MPKKYETGFYFRDSEPKLIYIKRKKDWYYAWCIDGTSMGTSSPTISLFEGIRPAEEGDVRLYLKRKKQSIEAMEIVVNKNKKTLDKFLDILDHH